MIWTLLTQSYWRDEVFRIFMARESLLKIIQLAPFDGQPPFYYFLLHYWIKIFGDGEIATRSLSLIFFELLVFVGYKLAVKLLPKTKFSIIVVVLLVLNPLLLYYGFETRMYMLLILLATSSYYFLWTKKWKLWVVASVLGLYTHNFMIFALVSQFVWLFLNKELTKKIYHYLVLVGLLYLPWIPVVLQQTRLIESNFWIAPLSPQLILFSLAGLLTGYEGTPIALAPFFAVLSILLLISVMLGRLVNKKVWRFLVAWLVLPGLFTFILSALGRSLFITRYLCFLSIPLVFLLALCVYQKNIWWKTTSLIILAVLSIYLTQTLYPTWIKTDIRSTISTVATVARPQDIILTGSLNYFETRYYFERDMQYQARNAELFAKTPSNSYTNSVPIKIYAPGGDIPFFVGKVLIPNEDVIAQIPQDRRVFLVKEGGGFTISLPVQR